MRLAFLGLGLIGGSIARAVRRNGGDVTIAAWTPDGTGPTSARDAGVVDAAAATADEAISGADLVVLAAPVPAIVALLARFAPDGDLRPVLASGATLTDVASSKGAVMAAAESARVPFVGGHPMAGRETAGFGASDPELLAGRPWVVVQGAETRPVDVERVESLARAVGSVPVRADAVAHDRAVARISHMPLVLSAALADAIAGASGWSGSLERQLAASGWDSMTRLAHGDPTMGAGFLATNAVATADAVRQVRAALDEWLALLAATEPDVAAMTGRLADARRALEAP